MLYSDGKRPSKSWMWCMKKTLKSYSVFSCYTHFTRIVTITFVPLFMLSRRCFLCLYVFIGGTMCVCVWWICYQMFYFCIHCSGWIVALDSKNASTLLLYALNSNIKFYEHQTLFIVHCASCIMHCVIQTLGSQLLSTIQSINLKLCGIKFSPYYRLISISYVCVSSLMFSIHLFIYVQHSYFPFPYFCARFWKCSIWNVCSKRLFDGYFLLFLFIWCLGFIIHPFIWNIEVSKLVEWHQIASLTIAKSLWNRELKQSYKINVAKWYGKRCRKTRNSLLSEHFLNTETKTLRRNEETMVWLIQIVLNDIFLSLKCSYRRAYHLFSFFPFFLSFSSVQRTSY